MQKVRKIKQFEVRDKSDHLPGHKKRECGKTTFSMPLTGVEPVRYFYRGILSPLRLPVPPQRLTDLIIIHHLKAIVKRSFYLSQVQLTALNSAGEMPSCFLNTLQK